ncbi:MAG: S1 RNA-binding domain-containing protein [Paludibaculum sp.]
MKVVGRVVSVTHYGSFVELEPGVEGLIHISEMTWSRRMKHPSKVVRVGDNVESVVLEVKPKERRISLGIKQLEPDPWTGAVRIIVFPY